MKRSLCRMLLVLLMMAVPCTAASAEKGDLHFDFRLPASLGWWTPVNEDWHGIMSGVGGIRAGIELFPLTQNKVSNERGFRPSLRLLAGYRFGIGEPDTYSARLHTVGIDCSFLLRYNFTRQHHGFMGVGALWQMDILDYNSKYRGRKRETWRGTALSLCMGYELALNDRLWAFAELGFAHIVAGGLFDTFMPVIGLSWGL